MRTRYARKSRIKKQHAAGPPVRAALAEVGPDRADGRTLSFDVTFRVQVDVIHRPAGPVAGLHNCALELTDSTGDLDGHAGFVAVTPDGLLAPPVSGLLWPSESEDTHEEFSLQVLDAINAVMPPATSAKGGDA